MSLVITRNNILWFPGLGEPLASKPGKHDQTWQGQGVGEEDQLLCVSQSQQVPLCPCMLRPVGGMGGVRQTN